MTPASDQRVYAYYLSRPRYGPDDGGRGAFWLTIARKFRMPVEDCKAAVAREQERLGRRVG